MDEAFFERTQVMLSKLFVSIKLIGDDTKVASQNW